MLNKEYSILVTFTKEPWKSLTYKEIKQISKNKSDNYVHTVLKNLVKQNIIQQKRIGNNIIYSIGENIFALNEIGFVAEYVSRQGKHLPHNNIQKLIDKIKTSFFIFIITGSYAKNKQKPDSDIDVAIICDDKQSPNAILAEIKLEGELMHPEAHIYVFTQSQFYEMLTNNEENYGKKIARNNLIICGGKDYYSILLNAAKHGFSG